LVEARDFSLNVQKGYGAHASSYSTITKRIPLHAFMAWVGKTLPTRFSRNSCSLVKGKAIPLEAWTGPEGSRRLMLSDFMTIGT